MFQGNRHKRIYFNQVVADLSLGDDYLTTSSGSFLRWFSKEGRISYLRCSSKIHLRPPLFPHHHLTDVFRIFFIFVFAKGLSEVTIRRLFSSSIRNQNKLFCFYCPQGTKVGDPEELKAVDEIICKKRDKPLLIGSVKSNIGHCEGSSGLASLIKVKITFEGTFSFAHCLIFSLVQVILSMEKGHLLPNLNFKTPRKEVEALQRRRMIVVDENMPWPDDSGIAGWYRNTYVCSFRENLFVRSGQQLRFWRRQWSRSVALESES